MFEVSLKVNVVNVYFLTQVKLIKKKCISSYHIKLLLGQLSYVMVKTSILKYLMVFFLSYFYIFAIFIPYCVCRCVLNTSCGSNKVLAGLRSFRA